MVHKVTQHNMGPSVLRKGPQANVADASLSGVSNHLLNFCLSLPWESLVSSSPDEPRRRKPRPPVSTYKAPPAPLPASVPAQPPVPTQKPAPSLQGGPGCQAADACLLVHGYLVNLAEGKSGFGVLRVAKERMEAGAAGAAQMGQAQLAQEMRAVARELPQVTTPEAAAALAPRLKELSDQTWDLGRRCGGHNLNPAALEQARALASKVQKGELSMEEAVSQVRGVAKHG